METGKFGADDLERLAARRTRQNGLLAVPEKVLPNRLNLPAMVTNYFHQNLSLLSSSDPATGPSRHGPCRAAARMTRFEAPSQLWILTYTIIRQKEIVDVNPGGP